jgi:predicted nucleic acid-binding Zn ribbon protein
MRINPHRQFGVRECPSCGSHVPANSNHCPLCRNELLNPTPARRNVKILGAVLLLALLALMLISGALR